MRKALALGTVAALLALGGTASAQTAIDSESTTVTAAVVGADLAGGRTLAVTTAPALASAAGATTGAMTVAVTETLAQGVAPSWSVTAEVTSDLSAPGVTGTIPKEKLSTTSNTVVSTAVLGQTVGEGAPGAFSAARELMKVSGQSTSASYTNLYTITSGLALELPSGTEDGTYTAPMTVTLWQ